MSVQNGRAFNEWLRSQLKAKKMSQRQLAQQAGVDHSTISRLIRGDRTPSLGTATKLAPPLPPPPARRIREYDLAIRRRRWAMRAPEHQPLPGTRASSGVPTAGARSEGPVGY